jgi:hypothetical protein
LGEKERTSAAVFMTPEDLLRSCDRLRINGDNEFEEILEQNIIYLETRGHVLTPFLEKNRSKGIRRSG